MPKIAALMQLPDGRIGVALDCPRTDEGSVTIWTEAEREREIRLAVLAEREACAELMDEMVGGVYAEAIRNRTD